MSKLLKLKQSLIQDRFLLASCRCCARVTPLSSRQGLGGSTKFSKDLWQQHISQLRALKTEVELHPEEHLDMGCEILKDRLFRILLARDVCKFQRNEIRCMDLHMCN